MAATMPCGNTAALNAHESRQYHLDSIADSVKWDIGDLEEVLSQLSREQLEEYLFDLTAPREKYHEEITQQALKDIAQELHEKAEDLAIERALNYEPEPDI